MGGVVGAQAPQSGGAGTGKFGIMTGQQSGANPFQQFQAGQGLQQMGQQTQQQQMGQQTQQQQVNQQTQQQQPFQNTFQQGGQQPDYAALFRNFAGMFGGQQGAPVSNYKPVQSANDFQLRNTYQFSPATDPSRQYAARVQADADQKAADAAKAANDASTQVEPQQQTSYEMGSPGNARGGRINSPDKKIRAALLTAKGVQAKAIGGGSFSGPKYPDVEKLAQAHDKFIYHSGTVDDLDNMKWGLEPQHGPWIQELANHAGDMEPEEILDRATPLVWFSDSPSWVAMKVARKLDKPASNVTEDEIRQHGHVAIVPRKGDHANHIYHIGEEGLNNGAYSNVKDLTGKTKKAYETELYDDNKEPFGVERNEYVSAKEVEPLLHLTGDHLVNFLRAVKRRGQPASKSGGGALAAPGAPALPSRVADRRIPELQDAADMVAAGQMGPEEYHAQVGSLKPVRPYTSLPPMATREDLLRGLSKDKHAKIGAEEAIPEGHAVGLRLDIPAYNKHGVWAPTIHEGHEKNSKPIAHAPFAHVSNPVFSVDAGKALGVARGNEKAPFAKINGFWKKTSPEDAQAMAQEYLNHPEWRQVGMDPERHSFFYDRETRQPVVSADEALQIGPLVLAKNPQYGSVKDFQYEQGGRVGYAGGGGEDGPVVQQALGLTRNARKRGVVPPEERQQRQQEQGFEPGWYHGSERIDRIVSSGKFDPKRATSGPMAFFTNNPQLASSYADKKVDTSLRNQDIENVGDYFTVHPKHLGWSSRTPITVERSWNFLPHDVKQRIAQNAMRVGYENPDEGEGEIIRHPEGVEANLAPDHYRHLVKEHRGNHLAALRDLWHDSGSLIGQEEKLKQIYELVGYPHPISDENAPWYSRPGVVPVALKMQNPLNTSDVDYLKSKVIPHLEAAFKRDRTQPKQGGVDMWDKNTRYTPKSWVQQLKEDVEGGRNSYVWTSIPDKVTEQLRALGHDAILDKGGKGGTEQHDVAIPFAPTQVRSVFANYDPKKMSSSDLGAKRGGLIDKALQLTRKARS